MTHLSLPLICITCLPPWPQAMIHAGKNIENRDASVAARLAPFVGQNIGISQSKKVDFNAVRTINRDLGVRGLLSLDESGHAYNSIPDNAGKLLLVARLDRVAKPSEYGRNPWHVQGQHGLVLGKVWQVEQLPARGAVGAWSPRWCGICHAISAPNANMKCTVCKTGALYNADGERPQLRIVRECQ